MLEVESFSVQRLAPNRQLRGARTTVDRVGYDRVANRREMDPDLMSPTRLRISPHVRNVVKALDHFITSDSGSPTGAHGHPLPLDGMTTDGLADLPFGGPDTPVRQRDVLFLDLTATELCP
jgi:hypothetical protein